MLGQIELGQSTPTINVLWKIARALEVTFSALISQRTQSGALVPPDLHPAAVFARVIYDVARDSTTHNLWPFEIVLALGPGLLAGLAGAIAGALMVRWRGA